MRLVLRSSSRPTRWRATRGLLGATVVAVSALTALAPTAAWADDSSTLTVVGTSDVFDSFLVQNVLQPGFQKAFPQYHLNYVSKGTGAAIQYAEAGTASALLVHAASLENQFVDQSYSAEPFGRALFYGDYVLLGPANDPAGVAANDPHDIVGAFQRIAAAGAAGTANFVSRGGTPGTTVQEHAIWQLSHGITTCTVSAANGGGVSPSTTSGSCPTSISYPSWYHATGLTQAPNIQNGDVCNYTGGSCYVFTDRGTFDYLQSIKGISNLKVVTRDNAATATGGDTLLVNSFHGYAVNPAKFSPSVAAQINLPAAEAFLNWVTSPAAQRAVGAYLSAGGDPPFLPDAAPRVTATTLPKTLAAGKTFTITGSVRNVVPGTPPLVDQVVTLSQLKVSTAARKKGAVAVPVAQARTNVAGNFTLRYRPSASATYVVSTGVIRKVEIPTLSPVFGDQLAPASVSLGRSDVTASVTIGTAAPSAGSVTLSGRLSPAPDGAPAHITVSAGPVGGALKAVAAKGINKGRSAYAVSVPLAPGTWTVRVDYASAGQFGTAHSATKTVVVP